jgi:hypothetical protein
VGGPARCEKAAEGCSDPRVALSIVDFDDPYSEAQLRGRIVERRADVDLKTMDSISHKYIGQPFPMAQSGRPRHADHGSRKSTLHEAPVQAPATEVIPGFLARRRRAGTSLLHCGICKSPKVDEVFRRLG